MPPWTRQRAARLAAAAPPPGPPAPGGGWPPRGPSRTSSARLDPHHRVGREAAQVRLVAAVGLERVGVAGHQPARREAGGRAARARRQRRLPGGGRRSSEHLEVGAGRGVGRVEGGEDHHLGDVVGRHVGRERGLAQHGGVDAAGRDRQGLHAERAELLGQAAGEAEQRPTSRRCRRSPPACPGWRRCEATLTIRPWRRAFMPGTTARAQRNGPVRLTSSERRQRAGREASTAPRTRTPALLTSRSQGPSARLVLGHQPRHVGLAGDVAGHRQRRPALGHHPLHLGRGAGEDGHAAGRAPSGRAPPPRRCRGRRR